ncbi:hypothetical protein [Aeromicrobium sp.]|uniref:hypothetical protein n=1 Tax=Aeromicrobium sp. TaxID=1871063 RepID=UPI0025C03AB2|nr:hypothetical protein [Aeromicrobium sp.]MCK5892240.1 hypothetical protein [Aeromicrobium sp.]
MRTLDEASWAGVVRATGLDGAGVPLRPLGHDHAGGGPAEPALVEAAALALSRADVGLTVMSGTGERGVLAQLGSDQHALGVAIRAVVAGDAGPVAVPGVRLGAHAPGQLTREVMRLVPPGGEERRLPRGPVTLDQEAALIAGRTAVSDPDVALAAVRHAGLEDVPPVLQALARGTSASVTMTVSTGGGPLHAVRQWLLTDRGWVSLTVRGRRVTHTASSRAELTAATTSMLAGAWDAALVARERAS